MNTLQEISSSSLDLDGVVYVREGKDRRVANNLLVGCSLAAGSGGAFFRLDGILLIKFGVSVFHCLCKVLGSEAALVLNDTTASRGRLGEDCQAKDTDEEEENEAKKVSRTPFALVDYSQADQSAKVAPQMTAGIAERCLDVVFATNGHLTWPGSWESAHAVLLIGVRRSRRNELGAFHFQPSKLV